MRSVPHNVRHLNTRSPVGGAALPKELCHQKIAGSLYSTPVFEARSSQLGVPATMPADTVALISCHDGLQSCSRTASLSQPFLLEGALVMVFGDSNRKVLIQGICPSQPGLGYDLITSLILAG